MDVDQHSHRDSDHPRAFLAATKGSSAQTQGAQLELQVLLRAGWRLAACCCRRCCRCRPPRCRCRRPWPLLLHPLVHQNVAVVCRGEQATAMQVSAKGRWAGERWRDGGWLVPSGLNSQFSPRPRRILSFFLLYSAMEGTGQARMPAGARHRRAPGTPAVSGSIRLAPACGPCWSSRIGCQSWVCPNTLCTCGTAAGGGRAEAGTKVVAAVLG